MIISKSKTVKSAFSDIKSGTKDILDNYKFFFIFTSFLFSLTILETFLKTIGLEAKNETYHFFISLFSLAVLNINFSYIVFIKNKSIKKSIKMFYNLKTYLFMFISSILMLLPLVFIPLNEFSNIQVKDEADLTNQIILFFKENIEVISISLFFSFFIFYISQSAYYIYKNTNESIIKSFKFGSLLIFKNISYFIFIFIFFIIITFISSEVLKYIPETTYNFAYVLISSFFQYLYFHYNYFFLNSTFENMDHNKF